LFSAENYSPDERTGHREVRVGDGREPVEVADLKKNRRVIPSSSLDGWTRNGLNSRGYPAFSVMVITISSHPADHAQLPDFCSSFQINVLAEWCFLRSLAVSGLRDRDSRFLCKPQ
jgi:hypothetical protein